MRLVTSSGTAHYRSTLPVPQVWAGLRYCEQFRTARGLVGPTGIEPVYFQL